MISWTNHDRAAFNEWCNTDLGQKFLAYFRENRPKFETGLDINAMAMMGAIYTGYERAIEQLDQMRLIRSAKGVEIQYVDTHKD